MHQVVIIFESDKPEKEVTRMSCILQYIGRMDIIDVSPPIKLDDIKGECPGCDSAGRCTYACEMG